MQCLVNMNTSTVKCNRALQYQQNTLVYNKQQITWRLKSYACACSITNLPTSLL